MTNQANTSKAGAKPTGSKPKHKPIRKPAAKPKPKGYKGHRAGSRKEQVHKVYDQKGEDAAKKLGEKLGLKASTLQGWISTWKREGQHG